MPDRYEAWIAANVCGDTVGRCAEWTRWMQRTFPELTRVRGHVRPAFELLSAGKPPVFYCHWWLETVQGIIVDPTVAQFPWPVVYTRWEEGMAEPTGKCYECGSYCYGGKEFCSDVHRVAYARAIDATGKLSANPFFDL